MKKKLEISILIVLLFLYTSICFGKALPFLLFPSPLDGSGVTPVVPGESLTWNDTTTITFNDGDDIENNN